MNSAEPVKFTRQEDQPIYPKILYNRPVTRSGAGRLLVPGGHTGELSLPAAMQQLALAAGAGECIVALPDILAKFIGGAPNTTFVASSPSGSLGGDALGRLVQLSEDADAVALGASLSNNSHTAILIERLVQEIERPTIVFADALTALQHHVTRFTDRPETLVILTMPEVFKLSGALGLSIKIRPDGGLLNKLEIVQNLAAASQCHYAVYGSEIIVAAGGELIVTPTNYRLGLQPAAYWAVLSTFWLQNPTRRHEGLATGSYILGQISQEVGTTGRTSTADLATSISRLLAEHEA